MVVVLSESGIAPRTRRFVARGDDEGAELTARHGVTADREGSRERHLVPRAFVVESLWFAIRRAHREGSGRYDDHLRAALDIAERLTAARQQPSCLAAIAVAGQHRDAAIRTKRLLFGLRYRLSHSVLVTAKDCGIHNSVPAVREE
jgi:hypothetical protein